MLRISPLVLVAIAALSQVALAQPPAPPRYSPTFSPYLNLARNGNSPALNYYGLVRPQLETRLNVQNLQTQVQQNYQNINGLQQVAGASGGAPAPTGFRVGYMTHLAYFQNNGSGLGQGGLGGRGVGVGQGNAGRGFGGATVGGGGASGYPAVPHSPSSGVRR